MAGQTKWPDGQSPGFSAQEWEWISRHARGYVNSALERAAHLAEAGDLQGAALAAEIRAMQRNREEIPGEIGREIVGD